MGQVVGRTVTSFKSLDYGLYNTGNHASEVRRRLDTPRRLENMLHTDRGSLWMPPSWDTLITGVSGTGDLKKIVQAFGDEVTLLVQKGTTVSLYANSSLTPPYTSATSTYVLTSAEKVWVVVNAGATYFGNSEQTIKATFASGSYTFTDVSASIPPGYHAMQYRNRLFVVERVFGTSGGTQDRLYYSDIGAPETFGADSFLDVQGYYEGDSWENALASPVSVQPFGDVLTLFMTQGIIRFTGTDPVTNFTLRPTMSQVGLWLRDTVSHIEPGLVFFGGTPRGEFGFYLYRGNGSEMVSRELNGLLREWVEDGTQEFDEDLAASTVWRNNYICALEVNDDVDLYVWNWMDQRWSTFTGYTSTPTVALTRVSNSDTLLIGQASATSVQYTSSPMARATPTTAARFVVGYEDEEQPSGLARYMRVRLTVNVLATGGTGVEFDLTATNAAGTSVVCPTQTLTTNGQHVLVFDLNLRGSAIELDFTITPSAKAQEATVENLELVQSRKPLKVARVGGQ